MASNRKRPIASGARWESLGSLLTMRRQALGYASRAAFASERGIRVSTCHIAETAYAGRVERFKPSTVQLIAQAYAVTYESVLAVLRGEADELAPVVVAPKAPRAPREPHRKRLGIQAPADAWKRLGEMLEAWRRVNLGYRSRVKFAADRLPPTPQGNANVRLVSDIENAYDSRINTFPAGTLREIAAAYGVAYESMLAVLRAEADELAPAAAAPRALPPAPMDDRAREDATRPYAIPIWERLDFLREKKRIEEPTGAELGLSPEDAGIWEGSRGAMSQADRAWLVADIQRRRDARDASSRAGTASALVRGNVAC